MQAVGLQTYIWNNNIRSALLLVGFPFLLLGMVFCLTLGMIVARLLPSGYEYGGAVPFALHLMIQAAPAAIVVAVIWFAIAYVFNQAIIDFATGSHPVTREQEPLAWNLLENLCISRGLKMPTLRLIETEGMNAFASGLHEGRFSVTVTRGLLQNLHRGELEAVLAHELTHIINRDVRTMIIAAVFAGIISLVAQILARALWFRGGGGGRRGGGMLMIVGIAAAAIAALLAVVIRLAISRRREYIADAGSVELTKNADAMISALQKVAGHAHLDAPEEVRGLFLENHEEGIFGLFSTHPPIEKRIAALVQYAGGRVSDAPEPVYASSPTAPAPASAPAGPWGPAPASDAPVSVYEDSPPTPPPSDPPPKGPWS